MRLKFYWPKVITFSNISETRTRRENLKKQSLKNKIHSRETKFWIQIFEAEILKDEISIILINKPNKRTN